MDKVTLEQIKKFLQEMKSDSSMKELRKTSYTKGYRACAADIERIIDCAESLSVQEQERLSKPLTV